MPGVVIRAGVAAHPYVASFVHLGYAANMALDLNGINSQEIPYRVMAPGCVGGIMIKFSQPLTNPLLVRVYKNGVSFFSRTVNAGETDFEEAFSTTDFPIVSTDELFCRIEGDAWNPSVQLKIM